MPGKTSEGFVKAAQKQKFIRNRDLKLKDSELKKEAHIQHTMVEGVCDKCREKLQWRFKYNKYKSLTKPGGCQKCKNKVVTKAYRTYCDPCAKGLSVCPGCAGDIKAINAFKKAQREEAEARKGDGKDEGHEEDELSGEESADEKDMGCSIRKALREDSEYSGEDDWNDEPNEKDEDGDGVFALNNIGLIHERDMRKFENMGKMKYSKNRVVGSVADQEISSVFSMAIGSTSAAPSDTNNDDGDDRDDGNDGGDADNDDDVAVYQSSGGLVNEPSA